MWKPRNKSRSSHILEYNDKKPKPTYWVRMTGFVLFMLMVSLIFIKTINRFDELRPIVIKEDIHEASSPNQELNGLPSNVEYFDLNDYQGSTNGKEQEEIVLILIPLKDSEASLPMMFRHLMNITYDHDLIDIGFLISDSNDDTYKRVSQYSDALQEGQLHTLLNKIDDEKLETIGNSNDLYMNYMPDEYLQRLKKAFSGPFHDQYEKPFRSIQIFQKDFGQDLGNAFDDRHDVKIQGIRRKLMARARNWLTSMTLKPYHSWVLWRDCDIELINGDFLESMMKYSRNFDVLVPNVWRQLPTFHNGGGQPYDLNSWVESSEALELAENLPDDEIIVEGYPEYATWRIHLANLREENGNERAIIELDGVGGVSLLSKAKVFRSGAIFPAFSFENHAETEGFGKMVKRMGMKIVGFFNYTVWHVFEPSKDDILEINELEKKRRNGNKKEE